jgi:hypothetical protein
MKFSHDDLGIREFAMVAALGILVAPAGAALSYGMFSLAERISARWRPSPAPEPEKTLNFSLEAYNDAVASYNVALLHLNDAIEDRFREIPKLRILLEMIDQDDFDAIFDDLMKREF